MSTERIYRVTVIKRGSEVREVGWDGGPVPEECDIPAWTRRRYLTRRGADKARARIAAAGGIAHIETSDPVTWPEGEVSRG